MKHILLFSSLLLSTFLLTACFEDDHQRGKRAGEKYCNCFGSTNAASSHNLLELYRWAASDDSAILTPLAQKLTYDEMAMHTKLAMDLADTTSSLTICLKKANTYREKNSPNSAMYDAGYNDAFAEPECELVFHYREGRIAKAYAVTHKK